MTNERTQELWHWTKDGHHVGTVADNVWLPLNLVQDWSPCVTSLPVAIRSLRKKRSAFHKKTPCLCYHTDALLLLPLSNKLWNRKQTSFRPASSYPTNIMYRSIVRVTTLSRFSRASAVHRRFLVNVRTLSSAPAVESSSKTEEGGTAHHYEIPRRIKQKVVTAEDAVSLVQPGDTVACSGFVCQGV